MVSGSECEQENIFEYRDALDDALIKQHIVAPERTSPYFRNGQSTTLYPVMEGWMTIPLIEFSSPSLPKSNTLYSFEKDENPYFELARFTKTSAAPIDEILQRYVTDEVSLDFLLHANSAKKGDVLQGGSSYYVIRTRSKPLEDAHCYTIQRFCSGFAEKDVCANFCRSFRCGIVARNFKKVFDYTFIETADRQHVTCDMSMKTVVNSFSPEKNQDGVDLRSMAYYSFILQTLFALEVLRMYKIQHNNISLDTIKCYQNDADVEYFEYTIDGVKIYVPNVGFVVKIDNFGSAVKYSHPTVGDVSEFEYDELRDLRTFAKSLPEEYRNQIFDEPNLLNQDIIMSYIGKPHGRGMVMGNIAPSSKHFSAIPTEFSVTKDHLENIPINPTKSSKKRSSPSSSQSSKKNSKIDEHSVSSSQSSKKSSKSDEHLVSSSQSSSKLLSKKRSSPSSSSDEELNAKKTCTRKSSLSKNYVCIQLDSLEACSGKDEDIIRMGLHFVDIFEKSKHEKLFDNCKFDPRTWSRINAVFNNRLIFSDVLNIATEMEGLIISDFALALSKHSCAQ